MSHWIAVCFHSHKEYEAHPWRLSTADAMQEMGDLLYSGGDAAVIEMFDSMKTKNAGGFLDYTCIR